MTSWPGRLWVLLVLLVPLAYLFVGMIIHALRTLLLANVPLDREVAARGDSVLLGSTVRQAFAWLMGPLERRLAASSVSPDALTMAGCGLCCFGSLIVAAGDLTVGGLVVLVSSGLDFLDGRIARHRGVANRGGEFLDSTADRYADAFCFGSAAFLLREEPWSLGAALVAFGATAIVPYARAKGEALGVDLRSGLMQRPERLVLFSAAAIFSAPLDPLWPAVAPTAHPTFVAVIWFLALATAGTAVSRTRDGVRRVREAERTHL